MNTNYQTLILKKNEILEEFKKTRYNDIEDLVYRMQLTYDDVLDILDLKYNPTKRTGNSLSPSIFEVVDLIKIYIYIYILPDIVKVSVTKDDVRLKSNLKINETLIFTEKSFFYTILSFTRSRFYTVDDIEGFYPLIAGSDKGDRPINITGFDKKHLKCDCIDGSIVNGVGKTILYSFVLSSPPGHKTFKEPSIKLFEKVNKPFLSHVTFHFEDDDHKPVGFNGESITFTCQLIKTKYSYL